jgi:hypothetical protein
VASDLLERKERERDSCEGAEELTTTMMRISLNPGKTRGRLT